jgi:hypothetical protein
MKNVIVNCMTSDVILAGYSDKTAVSEMLRDAEWKCHWVGIAHKIGLLCELCHIKACYITIIHSSGREEKLCKDCWVSSLPK